MDRACSVARWLLVVSAVVFPCARLPAAPVVIDGVPKMDSSTKRFSLHISALYGALQAMGCTVPYEELMVASGAAFRIAWLPGRYHFGAPEVSPEDLVANAAEAVGGHVERRPHATATDAWPVICESIDAGRPVLCWRGWGLGVICGYDAAGQRLLLQEYQNTTDTYVAVPLKLQDAPWPYEAPNEIIVLEYDPNAEPPDLNWPAILERAIQFADWPVDQPLFGQYPCGLAAYGAWAQTLRGGVDQSGAETDARMTEFMARAISDARASASLVLQENATIHEAFADAASAYMEEATLLKAMAAVLAGALQPAWNDTVALMAANFPRDEVREQAAQLVEQAKEKDMLAVEALREALEDLRPAPPEPKPEVAPEPPAPPKGAAEAEGQAKVAPEPDPGKSAAFLKMAKAAKDAKNYAKAEEFLRTALEADPGNVEAYRVLAWVLIELRRTDQAAAAFRKVIELAPGSEMATEAQKALERLGQ